MNMISAVACAEMERMRSAAGAVPMAVATSAVGPALSWEEQGAVLASLADGRASIRTGSFGRIVRVFFGLRPAPPLAGKRLEALRRYALLYRLKGAAALPEEEQAHLRGAGFSDRQAEAARMLVDARATHRRERARGGGRLVGAVLFALAAAAIVFVDKWLAQQVDDQLGALVITIMLVTWIVSIAAVTGHPHTRRA